MKRNIIILAAAALLLLALACNSCSGITKVTDVITNPSAREVYAREFKDNKPLLEAWNAAYDDALSDSLLVALSYGEKGAFNPEANLVHSYTVEMQEGEVLAVEVTKDSTLQRVFIDVMELRGTGFQKVGSNDIASSAVRHQVNVSGTYKVLLQPEIAANTGFFITIRKEPLYSFPVAGKGNGDIGSFWGVERDGGKRTHEGIDIFAKKGTPVVAATDGVIGFTGERGLGGKQVWLRGLFGNNLYYAHLDAIAVQSGNRVKTGDTLGFVGNTGNARFTPPHLHFGIYSRGAVNPLPFVYQTEKIVPAQFPQAFKSGMLKVKSKANIRQGPGTTTEVVGALSANDTVVLLGQAKDWLHIVTPLNQKAFLHKSLVKGI